MKKTVALLHKTQQLRDIKKKSMIFSPKGRSNVIEFSIHHITKLPKCVIYATLSIVSLIIGNNVSALTYSDNIGVNFTFSPSLSVSLSSSDIVINDLTPGTSSDSNIVDINVLSNNLSGYSLNATVGNDSTYNNTNLTSISGNTFTSLTPSDSIVDISSFNDNQWGYSYSDQTVSTPTWSDYSGLPLYNTTGATLKTSTSPSLSTGDIIKFKIAAKASPTQASGTYSNVINFTVVGNTNPTSFYDAFREAQAIDPTITTLNGYYKMQDMNTSICNSVYTSQLADNTDTMEAQLIDIRDNNIYWVAKLKDGHCWMTQNLDLDLSQFDTLTSDDTDLTTITDPNGNTFDGYSSKNGKVIWELSDTLKVPATVDSENRTVSGWDFNPSVPIYAKGDETYVVQDRAYHSLSSCMASEHLREKCLHYAAGSYYNWASIVATNNAREYTTGYIAMRNSICPNNWTLPNGPTRNGDEMTISNYNQLLVKYSITNITDLSGGNKVAWNMGGFDAIGAAPLYFTRSGYADDAIRGFKSLGYYGTGTISSKSGDAYSLYYTSDGLYPAGSFLRSTGRSVRCLANNE